MRGKKHGRPRGKNRFEETNPDRRTYTVTEVAKILGISRAAAYLAVKNGELPRVKFIHRILVPRKAIDEIVPP